MTEHTTTTHLSVKDWYDMTLKMGDKVESSWRQFYFIILAVAAWGFTAGANTMPLSAKLALLFATLTFTSHNYIALLKLYVLLSVLAKETYARATDEIFIVAENRFIFSRARGHMNFERVRFFIIGTHTLCYCVLLHIWITVGE